MYTTPRKVKQESRLRRSLSLTNSNNNNNGRPNNNSANGPEANGDDPTYSRQPQNPHYLNGIAEFSSSATDPFSSKPIPIELQNGSSRNRFSYTSSTGAVIIPDVIDVSQPDGSSLDFQHHYHLPPSSLYEQQSVPPPYRNPPRTGVPTSLSDHYQQNGGTNTQPFTTSAPISPQSVPDSPVDAFHTHSAKFPIVKEVIISEREIQSGPLGTLGSTPQRSISAGTLPRLQSTPTSSSSDPPTLPQQIPTASTSLLTPEYIKKFQNKKLTKHLAWKDERRALTLDSETAKELQNQLAAAAAKQKSSDAQGAGSSTIRRSGSAFELQKLIEAFNEEQHALVMSSLQQGLVPSKRGLDGIDNPALDIGFQNNPSSNGHPHNIGNSSNSSNPYLGNNPGKMAGYSFSDSSASQSLSLSSSNTDSLDTVIYKGPNAPATSVRDWQRSKETMQNADFGHRNDGNSMPMRGDSQGLFDSRSYPMQQASSSTYQPMQFNGPGGSGSGQTPSSSSAVNGGYSMEYRHQQQVQQQNLSVQSVHQPQPPHHHHSQQNGGMRQPNGPTPTASQLSYNASASPMLPTKSPMVTHKPLLPPPGPSPSSSSNQSVPSVGGGGGSSNLKSNLNGGVSGNSGGGGGDSSSVGLDKAKDSTKMFPTKTYNHIKDMISSRFGNNNSAASATSGMPPKGLNNSAANTNSNNSNGAATNGNFNMNGQNGMNSYMDSSPASSSMGIPVLPSYGHSHGHLHGHMHDSYGSAPAYYASPPAMSPPGNNGANNSGNQQPMMNGANSYRSPPMNDRKNVNTSFRKAIHQSTMKSNLTEESLQLRPIMESANVNGSNRDLYRSMQYPQQNGDQSQQQQQQQRYGLGHEPPSPSLVPHHVERAQRALDKLCEPGGPQFHRTGSGPMTHQNGISRMVQQFSGGNNEENRAMYPNGYNGAQDKGKIGATSSGSGASQLTTGGELGAIPRNRFSVTPGPSSSTSNSSGGMGAGSAAAHINTGGMSVESSLSSPSSSSYTHSSKHHAPTTSLPNGNNTGSSSNNNNKSGGSNNNNDQPPPLPTSQKPEVSGASGHSSSGLSHHHLHHLHNHNTLGLPPVLAGEKRENGDGSSGTMETPSSGTIHLESAQGATGAAASGNASSALALNKSKSEQLKKITSDLHNLAISVAAEQHFHNHHLQFASGSGSNNNQSSSSECENKGSQRIGSGQSHTTSDSGVGTVMLTKSPLNSISDHENNKIGEDLLGGENPKFGENVMDSVSSGNDSEWVDIVEPEIRQILELEKKANKPGKSLRPGDKMTGVPSALVTSTPAHIITQGHHGKVNPMANGNASSSHTKNGEQPDLMGDITASPIPHHRLMSGSPSQSPKIPKKFDLNSYNKKASQNRSQELLAGPSGTSSAQNGGGPSNSKVKSPRSTTKVNRSNSGAGQQRWNGRSSRGDKGGKNANAAAHRLIKDLGLKGIKLSRHAASQILYPHDDNGDMTSTTTGLDLESMLDGQTEQTSDDDDDMSTTIDTTDAHAIRRQLESLESMYTEVLKVLGAKRFSGNRYPTNDLRNAKRRPYGSMSSLPSSVSSRPFRERKLKLDDKKKVKDIKSINKRFQRLESHVVTLARSVAHLSSEMRTQHMMVQEIESIRNEMQQLRNQVVKSSMQNQSAAAAAAQNFARVASGRNGAGVNLVSTTDWTSFRNALPSLTNPCRVRKLTKFFGDEPPLVRIFLKKLGYEKYASAFEQERIGIMELPYLTEERLNKMGIPMGPRLRILQEAQLCLKPGYHQTHESHHTHHQSNNHGPGNLSVYVV